MKIIRAPYSRTIQSAIDQFLILVGVFSVVGVALSVGKRDWTFLMGALLVGAPIWIYLWMITNGKLVIATKEMLQVKVLDNINSQGFKLSKNHESQRIHWKDIQKVELKKEKELILTFKEKKVLKLDDSYSRWYALLQNIPKSKMQSSKISEFLERTFENLETCPICGHIALNEEDCLSCHSQRYNLEMKEIFKEEIDYIKEEQFELFSTLHNTEEVQFYPDYKDGFKRDSNWKPMVNEQEVIDYSRENNWD